MIRALVTAMASVLLLAASAAAQAPLELKVKDRVAVPAASVNIMAAPFACDSDGNVLLRPDTGRSLPEVLKVSADGTKATHFRVTSAPGFEHSEHSAVQAFAVSPDGDIYIATTMPPSDPYLLRFDRDGQYRSSIKLESEGATAVMQLAVLSSKFFFVSGSRFGGKNDPIKSFAGVFDDNGRMVATVKFPPPEKRKAGRSSSGSAHTEESSLQKLESTLDTNSLSLAESGGDDNVYFTRYEPGGPTYVVSPAGEVLKQIRLDAPKETGFELQAAKAAGGRLAIMYVGQPPDGGTSPVKIFVYNVHTGEKAATYFYRTFEIGNALACYSPDDTFTFISSEENGKMLLVRASAR
ncbi:MAG: hypothetical protein WCC22_04095 [Terriglobales bacterium]